MSWQAYVDSSLVGTGTVDKAAIFSAAGDGCWATSPGFKVAPAEIQAIVTAFKEPGGPAFQKGILVEGTKYMTVKSEDKLLVGKQGKTGIVCAKTHQAILVAHHPDSVITNNTTNTVVGLAQYLESVGY